MSLLAESKRVAAEFEYTDEDVRRGVAEFIKEMSMCVCQLTYAMELMLAQRRDWKRTPQT